MANNNSKENRFLIKNTLIYSIGGVGSKIISYLLVPMYTSIMSKNDYGVADLFQLTINIMILIGTIKIASSLVRFTLEDKEHVVNYLGNGVLVVIVASFFMTLIYRIVDTYFLHLGIGIQYFWILFVLSGIRELFAEGTKALEYNKIYVLDGVLYGVAQLAFGFVCLHMMEQKILAFVVSQILTVAFSFVFLLVILKNEWFGTKYCFQKIIFKEMINYSKYLAPAAAGFWIIQFSDRYMVKYMMGNAASGMYAVAYKIPSICGVIVSFFLQAWYISSIHQKENKEYYSEIFNVYQVAVSIATCGIIMFARIIGHLLFQKEFYSAWEYVPLLVIAVSVSYYVFFMENILVASKDSKSIFYTTILGAVINVVLNAIFIKRYGIHGAIISTMLSYIAIFIVRYHLLRKKKLLEIDIRKITMNYMMLVIAYVGTKILPIGYMVILMAFMTILLINKDMIIDMLRVVKEKK